MLKNLSSEPGEGHAARQRSVTGAIAAHARATPQHIAVIDRGRHVTYAELERSGARVAAWLLAQGVAPGDVVGLTLRDEFTHLLVSLALLRLGCRQCTLASRDPPAMRGALAARLGAALVVADGTAEALPGAALLVPDIAAMLHGDAPGGAGLGGISPGAGCLIVTSSGTTGRPKLVAVSEAALVRQSEMTAHLGLSRYRTVPNEFDTAKRLQFHTLVAGGTEVLANNGAAASIAEVCARFGVQRVNMAPVKAELLLAELARPGAAPWPVGTGITLAGGAVPGALRRRLACALGAEICVLYGTSETGPVTIAEPAHHALHADAVGMAAQGVAVEVVADDGGALPRGERGHVRIRSPAMSEGYLDDPEATALAFHGGWFHPGDIGHLTPEGALVLAGRSDEMMNLGTLKIFPAEIEAAAEGFPGVLEHAAFARHAPALGDIPMLAVVASAPFDAQALLAHCRALLGVRAPRKVLEVAALPRNARGKVLRRALADLPDAGSFPA